MRLAFVIAVREEAFRQTISKTASAYDCVGTRASPPNGKGADLPFILPFIPDDSARASPLNGMEADLPFILSFIPDDCSRASPPNGKGADLPFILSFIPDDCARHR